jgi:uncharacterized MAPEG superfamily protein
LYAQTIWGEGFNNENPRAASASVAPNSFIARLYNAHVNMQVRTTKTTIFHVSTELNDLIPLFSNPSQEAFPMFAIPMILCIVLDREANMRAKLALIFVIARVLYQIAYMANLGTLRSLFWHFGFVASVYLAVLPALPRGVSINTIWVQVLDLVGTITSNFQ